MKGDDDEIERKKRKRKKCINKKKMRPNRELSGYDLLFQYTMRR